MTIAVAAEPGFAPPRVAIDLSLPEGSVMESVSVWRNDPSGRTDIRQQPSPGFDTRQVFDYECPYGVPVSYGWEASYADGSNVITTFSDDYSTYPTGWTGDTGEASVISGRLTLSATSVTRQVVRALSATQWDEIEIDFLSAPDTGSTRYQLDFAGGGYLQLQRVSLTSGGSRVRLVYTPNSTTAPVIASAAGFVASLPLSVVRTATSLVVRQGSTSVAPGVALGAPGNLVATRLVAAAGFLGTVIVGPVTARRFVDPTVTITETSSSVTLNPADAWLVAPQAPALSFPVSREDGRRSGFASQDSALYESRTTIHQILGASLPVTTTSGPRNSERTLLKIRTITEDESAALLALLSTGFPFLLNVPPQWDLGLPHGYFVAEDVNVSRVANIGNIPDRDFSLPLVKVRAPNTDVENVGWDYATLATTFSSYSQVRSRFATYADLAANRRS
jgi:hypothetical protein